MAILYKKGLECKKGILKYQTGGETPYIYESVEEAAADPKLQGVKTRNARGNPICFGSAWRMGKKCGFDYRTEFYRNFSSAKKNHGDDDGVVDAWDALNAAKSNPDYFEVLYESGVNTLEELEKIKGNLPYGSMIQTGDARRGKTKGAKSYVSGEEYNPQRVSRHSIINVGYTKSGKPIIYDIGKYNEGIPSKYKDEINSIIVRKADKKYFRNPVAPTQELKTKQVTAVETPKQQIQPNRIKSGIQFESAPVNRNYYSSFMALLKNTLNIS